MVAQRPSAPDSSSSKVTIPKLNLDPVQSLQPWPVVVPCCNAEVTIPALPAVDWLSVLMPQDFRLDDVFPGLLEEEEENWVEEQLILGRMGVAEFQDMVLDVIETVSARKWWVTLRLIDVARSSWDVVGPEMLRRLDASRGSLSAWLDVLLIVVLNNMDPKDTTMFIMKLEAPPKDEDPEEMEMDRSSFLALGD